jgi:glycosyltransferase involved in cell wall biosynthesis
MALDDGRLSPPPESVSAADRLLAPPLRLVGRWLHRPAVSAWVVGSEYVRRAYAGAGIKANVLPLPVAVAQLPHVPFAQRHGAVFVGRLTHDKGALDLVKLAHSPAPLEIHAVGTGPLEGQLREQARDLPNLHVHGNLGPGEVWRRLSAARMLVVPSRWAEPVGLGALEAMAMGTPVIAYRVGGLAEAVGGAGAGVLTGPDAGELAAACRALDTDEPLWLQLSAAGRAHVAEHHRPGDYVARLMSVYAAAGAGPV